MENLELLIPLTYIPGVALLIMSTSQRYINLDGVIHARTPEQCVKEAEKVKRELKRAHLFRNSLIGFYLSVVFFALGSLVAFLVSSLGLQTSKSILEISSVIGVGLIVFSVMALSWESILTLEILKKHAKMDEE